MILTRYIYREIIQTLLWIIGLLLLILISIKFIHFLSKAATGELPTHIIFTMLGYKVIASLPKLLPAALLLAILLVFARMSRGQELLIFAAAGLGRHFQIRIILCFALFYASLTAVICLYLSPLAHQKIESIKQQLAQQLNITGISAGHFKVFKHGQYVFYTEHLSKDKRSMENVFLYLATKNTPELIKAKRAYIEWDPQTRQHLLIFKDGGRYVGKPNTREYQITEYEGYAVPIKHEKHDMISGRDAAMPLIELWHSKQVRHKAELHWRFALILSTILLALLAVVLYQYSIDGRSIVPFTAGILGYIIYSNLLGMGVSLIKQGIIPTALGLWWVHLILLLCIIILYYLPLFQQWHRTRSAHKIR